MCSRMTVLIRLRRSREKPACSGAVVGGLPPNTRDTRRKKVKRIRMSANLSQNAPIPLAAAVHGRPNLLAGFIATARGLAMLYVVRMGRAGGWHPSPPLFRGPGPSSTPRLHRLSASAAWHPGSGAVARGAAAMEFRLLHQAVSLVQLAW